MSGQDLLELLDDATDKFNSCCRVETREFNSSDDKFVAARKKYGAKQLEECLVERFKCQSCSELGYFFMIPASRDSRGLDRPEFPIESVKCECYECYEDHAAGAITCCESDEIFWTAEQAKNLFGSDAVKRKLNTNSRAYFLDCDRYTLSKYDTMAWRENQVTIAALVVFGDMFSMYLQIMEHHDLIRPLKQPKKKRKKPDEE